ncbi:hypothetical protein Tco_0637278, partial [Tanacetum coccineum]
IEHHIQALITASVPAVYMQEFWATVTYQKHHIRFKMNKKSYSFDMETFRYMLLFCPKLPGQKFVDPLFEEEILTFIRELGYPGNIKLLYDVKVDMAQILWGLYHWEKVDYVYLLWEDLVFQIEKKEYDAILPDYLTNPAMKESAAYKTYHDLATVKVQPKPKYVRRSSRTKTDEAPKPSTGKRVKATAKVAKFGKKKQPAPGLETLSDIALTEAEQMKLAIERSKTQLHISQPSSSGVHEGTGVTPGVPDVPTYESNDEQISWKSSEEEDDDEDNVSEHEDDDDDEEVQGVNIEGEAMDKAENNEEDEWNELYRDLNVNLEGQDVEMTDDQPTNSSSVSSGFVSNMLNPRPNTGIDSIFTLNTKATSLVDVSVTTIAEPPLVFATTLPPSPTPLTHMQQTPVPTPTIGPISSLQDLPNFGSLFGFDQRLKTLETEFSEFKQTNQFAKTVLSIPGIVDAYLANKMHEAVNTAALVEAYESDKLILDTYGDTESFKRCRGDEDKDEEPFAGSNRESKRRRDGKEPESTKTSQHPDWFQKPAKIPTLNYDWNKTLPAIHGPVQPWLSNLAQEEGPHESFDELMDTPLDFLTFMMNWLKIDILTPELLAGPTFELMKGTCKSLVELEYFFEEVYKATTDQLDWHNPEGQQYPHDLRKPLPLIPNSCGRQVIPFDHFINNDLAYLSGGVSSLTYATSVTKTKAADYGDFKRLHLQDIKDMLILLVQGKLTNLNVEDRLAFGVSLRMFTKDAYTAYSNPRGFMRIDELHKFSDGDQENAQVKEDNEKFGKIYWWKTVRGSILTDLKITPTKHERMTKPYSSPSFIANCFNARFLKTEVKVNKFQRSFRHSDTERRSRSDKVLKLKNFKKDEKLKLFKSTNQERYEYVGQEVTNLQDGKVNKMAKRDYAWLVISRCSRSHSRQAKEQAQDLKSMITTSNHKLMIEVKDYELRTKVEA